MRFEVADYDLAETLSSGQTFRWHLLREAGSLRCGDHVKHPSHAASSGEPSLPSPTSDLHPSDHWEGIVNHRWVRLGQSGSVLTASVVEPVSDWSWLTDYLQLDVDLRRILRTFPKDPALQKAVRHCRGLRLLRQDPWECLASFILSSTKQIVQIEQIVDRLCRRFGEPLAVPHDHLPVWSFPSTERIAASNEAELRACRMGFRAPYLLRTARSICERSVDLNAVATLPLDEARTMLMQLPGVGRKIADCVLLFAFGFPQAFPIDVWVRRALERFYFDGRTVKETDLREFVAGHFGPWAGYAQQYLFHYLRNR